jgi:hypothetical protein
LASQVRLFQKKWSVLIRDQKNDLHAVAVNAVNDAVDVAVTRRLRPASDSTRTNLPLVVVTAAETDGIRVEVTRLHGNDSTRKSVVDAILSLEALKTVHHELLAVTKPFRRHRLHESATKAVATSTSVKADGSHVLSAVKEDRLASAARSVAARPHRKVLVDEVIVLHRGRRTAVTVESSDRVSEASDSEESFNSAF